MPTSSPRPLRGPRSSPPSRGTRSTAAPSGLSVLVAGVDSDQRGPVEAAVRRALAARDPAETWSASLVRLGAIWSVTLQGPGENLRNISFTTEEHRLTDAIGEAIDRHEGEPTRESTPDPPDAVPAEERLTCRHCGQAILVTYEAQPEESKESAPLACPHCWRIIRVEIGSWAAVGGDYRAEKG